MSVPPSFVVVAPSRTLPTLRDFLGDVTAVELEADALIALEQLDTRSVLLDMSDVASGLDFIARTKQRLPEIVIAVVAPSREALAEALKAGAEAGVEGMTDRDAILALIDKLRDRAQLTADATRFRRRAEAVLSLANFENIVGTHPAMQQLLRRVAQVAQTRATVLIQGESGTGKELVAAAIHQNSKRCEGPLVRLNCAALAEAVLESELFGHERGAFTGAITRRDGRFKHADGGTLFLDEVSEIPPGVQVKLLRFLQEREFERVGGNETLKVDVRLVAATNRNLRSLVEDGRFREDLYYRLSVVHLEVPPLRARPSDILVLADHFLRDVAEEEGESVEGFTEAAREAMLAYPWPGNVRELRNCIEQAFVFAEHERIDLADLPIAGAPRRADGLRVMIPGATMGEIERYAILETLRAVQGSTVKAANILGISQRTIQYRLKEWGIDARNGSPESER